MLTQVLAMEWASDGIRVFAISPGYVNTPMVAEALATGRLDGELILSRTPQRRLAEPAEIADAILALTGETFKHLTGQTVVLDGGWLANGAY